MWPANTDSGSPKLDVRTLRPVECTADAGRVCSVGSLMSAFEG